MACSSPFFRDYLAELARREWLIASATSELGVGGDLRRSVCAVESDGARIRVTKRAPVISYGEEADDILLTARRAPDAAPARPGARARPQGRHPPDPDAASGTRSGCAARAASASPSRPPARPIRSCPVPFADIASQTMLPVSHVLWTSLWLGLASDAVGAGAGVRPRRGAAHAGHGAAGRASARRDRRRAGHDARDRPRRASPISSSTRTTPKRSPGSASPSG